MTPLVTDTTNLYWGGTTSRAGQRIWTMGQTPQVQPMGSPFLITPTITSAAPALWTDGTTTYFFIGLTGNIIKLNVTNQTLNATNTSPGSASVAGADRRRATTRIFAADERRQHVGLRPEQLHGARTAVELHRRRAIRSRARLLTTRRPA